MKKGILIDLNCILILGGFKKVRRIGERSGACDKQVVAPAKCPAESAHYGTISVESNLSPIALGR